MGGAEDAHVCNQHQTLADAFPMYLLHGDHVSALLSANPGQVLLNLWKRQLC